MSLPWVMLTLLLLGAPTTLERPGEDATPRRFPATTDCHLNPDLFKLPHPQRVC